MEIGITQDRVLHLRYRADDGAHPGRTLLRISDALQQHLCLILDEVGLVLLHVFAEIGSRMLA